MTRKILKNLDDRAAIADIVCTRRRSGTATGILVARRAEVVEQLELQ